MSLHTHVHTHPYKYRGWTVIFQHTCGIYTKYLLWVCVVCSTLSSVRPLLVLHQDKHSNRRGHRNNGEPITHQCVWSEQTADAHTHSDACTQTHSKQFWIALTRSCSSKLISFRQMAKVASPLFNLHACQRLRMFIFISFMCLFSPVCFEIPNPQGSGETGRRCWVRSRGAQGRGWQRRLTSNTGPQCPSVNIVCVCCAVLHSPALHSPAHGVLWVVAPVCSCAVTSLYEPSLCLSDEQKPIQRDTHTRRLACHVSQKPGNTNVAAY